MKYKKWSESEIDFLKENYGTKSVKSISRILDRTEVAVRVKVGRLHLVKNDGDFITLHQLVVALGLGNSYSNVKRKFLKNGLKTNRSNSLTIDYFWEWAEKHKHILDFSKFEKNLLGKEPSWVDEKRKADGSNPRKRTNNRPWTKEEDELLISKTKSYRYTYKDLSKEFSRTENAIKRRLYDLAVPYRPVPLDKHIKWSEQENERLIELYNKGFDSHVIANILGKSQLSLSDRIKSLGGSL